MITPSPSQNVNSPSLLAGNVSISPPPALWGNLKYLASADKHLPNLGQKLSKIRNPLRAGENKCQNISSEKIWI